MVIPPNTLPPSASLKARLLFIKRAGANPNSYPGVSGLAACFAETAFVLNTLNPAGLLQFSGANYRAVENEGAVEITVNRVGGSEGTVTVGYATSGGSATSADYVPTSGTLTFEPEVTSQTFTVSLLDDSFPEGAETVGLVLTNVTGNAGLGLAFATLTIADDDAPAGPAVKYYIASKGQAFVQTNPGAASLDVVIALRPPQPDHGRAVDDGAELAGADHLAQLQRGGAEADRKSVV